MSYCAIVKFIITILSLIIILPSHAIPLNDNLAKVTAQIGINGLPNLVLHGGKTEGSSVNRRNTRLQKERKERHIATDKKELDIGASPRKKMRRMRSKSVPERKLIKLKPEVKSEKKRLVRISVEVENFFQRQFNGDHPQHFKIFALLGRKVGQSASSPSTKNSRPRRVLNDNDHSSQLVIDIIGAVEINAIEANAVAVAAEKLSVKPKVFQRIMQMAKLLEQEVVGCALIKCSLPSEDGQYCTEPIWGRSNIHVGLQSVECASFSKSEINRQFVLLSIGKMNDSDDANGERQKFKSRRKNRLQDSSSSLGIEAFRFSSQALKLFEQGVLTKHPLARSKEQNHRGGRKRRSTEEVLHGTSVTSPDKFIQLNGSVLVNTREESFVEAILFAAPLPIVSLRQTDDKFKFQHIFPSKSERSSNTDESREYLKRFLSKIVENVPQFATWTHGEVAVPLEIARRLRDPHLLLTLSSSMDEGLFAELCGALIGSDQTEGGHFMRFPAHVVQALRILRDALQ